MKREEKKYTQKYGGYDWDRGILDVDVAARPSVLTICGMILLIHNHNNKKNHVRWVIPCIDREECSEGKREEKHSEDGFDSAATALVLALAPVHQHPSFLGPVDAKHQRKQKQLERNCDYMRMEVPEDETEVRKFVYRVRHDPCGRPVPKELLAFYYRQIQEISCQIEDDVRVCDEDNENHRPYPVSDLPRQVISDSEGCGCRKCGERNQSEVVRDAR